MRFNSLKEKCEYFRSISDYRLIPNCPVLVMLDGRGFSKLIKNRYRKPFDENFMRYMDETAKYICKNVQGAKFAYVQSDEISILLTDFDTPETDTFFGYRICKMGSIIASMAAAKFNQLVSIDAAKNGMDIENLKLAEFDCKCWNVPDEDTAFCHFLWRHNDCVRNSKQQACQTYIPHKELCGKNVDEQISLLKGKIGIDWNLDYSDGMKYGRLIYKEEIEKECPDGTTCKRNVWESHDSFSFKENKEKIMGLIHV